MPAAAVIPAPKVYIIVAAVKKLVVEYLTCQIPATPSNVWVWNYLRVIILERTSALDWVGCLIQIVYCEQMGAFKAGLPA